METAILLSHIDKRYSDRPSAALDDVSLTVSEGEVFGFIGPNGAGKSTTIKILTGIIQPSGGSASLFGIPVSDHRARIGLGYVPESPYLYDYLTPFEVLSMGVHLHKVQLDQPQAHIMDWLERFGIADVAHKRIRSFSKGMTQRTALAHALAVQPKLLILDEPLSGLDPIGRKEVVDILMDYKRQGGTLFFSSHVLHDVERLADRFGLIHRGKLATVSTPAEVLGDHLGKVNIRFRCATALPGAIFEGGETWRLELDREQIWPQLQAIQGQGGQLLELRSAVSLEQAFMAFVSQAGGADGGDAPPSGLIPRLRRLFSAHREEYH